MSERLTKEDRERWRNSLLVWSLDRIKVSPATMSSLLDDADALDVALFHIDQLLTALRPSDPAYFEKAKHFIAAQAARSKP